MRSLLEDKIKGVLFGQAIGDALGLGTEFMTKAEAQRYYPNGLYDYSQIIKDYHRSRWQSGDWTDDTEMLLCIAKAIIENKDINKLAIAEEFKKWFGNNPLGIGRHTYNVLSFADYTNDPARAAQIIWELNGEKCAGNGGIMRTSIIGLWNKDTERYAADICELTHYDPRCIGSCVIVATLIHFLVYHNRILPLDELIPIADRYDTRIKEYLLFTQMDSLDVLRLDDENIGYTLKTMAAAIWHLYHCNSFEDGLLSIVNAGGDADTNAAVTCSLLGAKFGYSDIPERYVNGLVRKDYFTNIADKLMQILVIL